MYDWLHVDDVYHCDGSEPGCCPNDGAAITTV
jgi:hypothetical protein